MQKKKILINTDLGDDVDDAVAIALALQSPELEVVGITTVFKNTHARAQMVKDLLEFYDRGDIPVYAGAGMPIIERLDAQELPIQMDMLRCPYVIDETVDGVDFIIDTVKNDPEVILVEMGAQTNLGLAFLKAPEVMKQAKIIGMGGAFLNSYPEWNIICDPEAARIVTDFAGELTMFGLDVTKYCKMTEEQLQAIYTSTTPVIQYLCEGMKLFQNKTGFPITFHDALLITYLIDPTMVTIKQGDYTVELRGESTRGTIVHKTNYYDLDPKADKHFYYATGIQVEKFRQIMLERVFC